MSKQPNPPDGGYWYGVAMSLFDGAGVEYIAGIAANDTIPKPNPARFRFSVFRVESANALVYLPIEDAGAGLTGAGTIYMRSSDGSGRYNCTSNKIAYDGPIPGFVPLPSILSLQAQITQLRQTIAHLPPTTTAYPLYIPAQPDMPIEGGELQMADGAGGVWAIDCRGGNLRFVHDGVVAERWPK